MTMTRRHPKGLSFLFLTEMWERFGFYIVQGLLVLYMTKAFGFSDDETYIINGAFTALVYISPMVGGFLADRLLGFKLAIVWGGIFLVVGYAILALPDTRLFYLGLATIIVGNGLFKPNISTLLGALYPAGDTARDSGFTLFYIGINLGVLLSSTSGYIKDYFGWHAVFLVASAGLIIGLATFATGIKLGVMKYNHAIPILQKKFFLRKPWLILYCLITIAALNFLLQTGVLGKWLLPLVGIFLLFFIFILAYRQETRDRNRLLTLNVLIISSVVFWALFLQMFFSANLFIDRLIDKQFFGFQLSTTVFYSLESIFVILVGPLFAWSWQSLSERNKNPSPFLKFVFAIFFVGLAFLALAISTYFADTNGMINPLWIVLAYFFITLGEMLLSPIGLSAVTLLSPSRLVGMMMGAWFVAIGFGGFFAGMLAKLSSVPQSMAAAVTELPIYRYAFLRFVLLAWVIALILFIFQALIKKSLQEREF